jgi:hypothetical protein
MLTISLMLLKSQKVFRFYKKYLKIENGVIDTQWRRFPVLKIYNIRGIDDQGQNPVRLARQCCQRKS